MDLNQAGTALPGRTESFNDGMNGTPGSVASSLNSESAVLNSQVAGTMATPHSVLQGLPGMSQNGMSPDDAARKLPGGYQMPSGNGMSSGGYEQAMRLRLLGNQGAF